MNLTAILDWLASLPPATLLVAMGLLAAAENVFPPLPADVLIAFGAFLAARANSSPMPALLSVLAGNVSGAFVMYALGRHFGATWTERKFHLKNTDAAESRITSWYLRYGVISLFLLRFVPGVRAVVTPFAGALRIPVLLTGIAVTLASAIWYGAVTLIAFHAGNNWDGVVHTIGRLARNTGFVAAAIVVAAIAALIVRRRRRAR
jgi:membrane protein DedA with SNARE-associated domain